MKTQIEGGQRQLIVSSSLKYLNGRVQALGQTAAQLCDRLNNSVCRVPETSEPQPSQPREAAPVVLANQIEEITEQVDGVHAQLMFTLETLEV